MSTDNLGVSARMKYGFLLDKMGGRLPVFRTESQEWVKPPWVMGGWLIRLVGCSDPHRTSLPVLGTKLAQWDAVYLADARMRLQGLMSGYDFTIRDVKDFVCLSWSRYYGLG